MKHFICRIQLSVTFILIAILFILTPRSFAAVLSWNANAELDLAGYKIYYGTASQNYTFVVDAGNVTDYNLHNLNLREEVTYYIALTSYDTAGNESDLSEELDYFADDEIPGDQDNCPEIHNSAQEDTYPPGGNGIGDVCECEGDFECDGDVDGLDSTFFRADFGRNQFNNPCSPFNPCTGDFDCDGDVDGWDGRLFKEDFGRNQFNNPCPACLIGEWCMYP